MKIRLSFFVFFIIYSVNVFALERMCTYPFEFKVKTDRFYPIMVLLTANKKNNFSEILLKSPDDEYLTMSKSLPIGCKEKSNFCLQNIQLNNDFKLYRFLYGSNQKGIKIKVYSLDDNETVAFILNNRNKYIGSIVLTNTSFKRVTNILQSLQENNHLCTLSEYETIYNSLGYLDIDKKLKLLYSMMLISSEKHLKHIKQDIIDLLKKKKEVIIDLPLLNIEQTEKLTGTDGR